jgi:hypothetical protein
MDAWAGQPVAQWSPDGELCFVAPTAYIRQPYTGPIVEFDGLFHRGRYTPDHRMPLRQTSGNRTWGFVSARDAAQTPVNNREIPAAGRLDGPGLDLTDDELRFLVAVRADGSFGGHNARRQYAPQFQFKKARKIDRLVTLLLACDVPYSITVVPPGDADPARMRGGQTRIATRTCPTVAKIRELLGWDKVYGPWVLRATVAQRRLMLEEEQWWDGESVKSRRGGVQLATSQRATADWLQVMAATSGMRTAATFDRDNNRGFGAGATGHTLHWFRATDKDHVRLRPGGSRDVREVAYTGEVFCFTVPSGAFLVRRNGAVWVTGNCNFDASILAWRYDIHPTELVCPMSMARSLGLGLVSGLSLDVISRLAVEAGHKMPFKGYEVIAASGKRLKDFSASSLAQYGVYCCTDVAILKALFDIFIQHLPLEELLWQSSVLKMYTERPFIIDRGIVLEEQERVRVKRDAAMAKLCASLGVADVPLLQGVIGSNNKLAEALQLFGAEVPMKRSKATGKQTFAFSKTDPEFLALVDHDIPEVAALAAARLDLKGSLEASRCVAMLEEEALGPFPVPLQVHGAHTGRLSGGGGGSKVNVQNFSSGRKIGQSKSIKQSLRTHPGYVLTGGDSSQIEVRVLDYIANDVIGIQNFAEGTCPYSAFAASFYPTPGIDAAQIKKLAKAGDELWGTRRQIAKVCVLASGYGIGAKKFQDYAKTQGGIELTYKEAVVLNRGYKGAKPAVVRFWKTCDRVLELLAAGKGCEFGGPTGKLFIADPDHRVLGQRLPGILGPDGLRLTYPGLEMVEVEDWVDVLDEETGDVIDQRKEWRTKARFITKKGKSSIENYTWGGTVTENLGQYLAFAIIKYQSGLINFPHAINEHDAVYVTSKVDDAAEALRQLRAAMNTTPPWVPGLPLSCEAGQAGSLGDVVKR